MSTAKKDAKREACVRMDKNSKVVRQTIEKLRVHGLEISLKIKPRFFDYFLTITSNFPKSTELIAQIADRPSAIDAKG